MRIYIPYTKKSYTWTSTNKVIKAIKPIVDNVKISSLSAVQKSRFKKQFISDCNNKKIGNPRGDNTMDQKTLGKVFREALKKKALPAKWIAERYSDLLTKGGKSLSSKWETAPKAPELKKTHKSSNRKKTSDSSRQEFNKELKDRLKIRREKLEAIELPMSRGEAIKKEDSGKDSDSASNKTNANKGDSREVKGFKKEGLKSAGQKRKMSVGSKGLYLPITSQGNFKSAGNSGFVFASQDLSQEINPGVSYRTLNPKISEETPEKKDEMPIWEEAYNTIDQQSPEEPNCIDD